jgi:ribosomal protein S18 acetylase RimI-like enzyme
MESHVRRAAIDDAAAIADLYTEVADEVVKREPTVRHAPDRGAVQRRYEARLQESDRGFFVAVVDSAVIGFVDAGLSPNTDDATYLAPGLDVYVEELVVTESLRNLGIGKSLMAAVEGWANEAGARMVTLGTHVTNSAARGFYASIGYREIGVMLAKNL